MSWLDQRRTKEEIVQQALSELRHDLALIFGRRPQPTQRVNTNKEKQG